jgi:hypothetical protein
VLASGALARECLGKESFDLLSSTTSFAPSRPNHRARRSTLDDHASTIHFCRKVFQPATPLSLTAFLLICVVVLAALIRGVWNSALRDNADPLRRALTVLVGAVVWLSLICAVVYAGWAEGEPTRTMALMIGINLVSVAIGLSPIGRWLAGASLTWLVAFQGFRLPLELVLHSWANHGVIPSTMTWTGANWDIVSGIIALAFAPFARRFIPFAWIANAVGLLLLINVIRVAVMSSPLPFAWPVTPKLALIYHLPYALILPVCVGGALIGHVALTRALIARVPTRRRTG